jgi:hypothetical protein
MGDAAVKYGFFGSSSTFEKPSLTSASETLAVGDKYGEVCICGMRLFSLVVIGSFWLAE